MARKRKIKRAIAALRKDVADDHAPDRAPDPPMDYTTLLGRLRAVEGTLPPVYEQTVYYPFVSWLLNAGPEAFASLVDANQPDQGASQLIADVTQSILQFGEGYKARSTDAIQEVISDLFDGFLSAADRRGIKLPDRFAAAPLVKWGGREYGPYIFPSETTAILGIGTGIVNMPPLRARRGLAAWAALPHEVAGHEILRADRGVRLELSKKVVDWVEEDVAGAGTTSWVRYFLAQYLSQRIDEAAADVLGILNMGPAALVALIAYFRAYNRGTLSGVSDDEHLHPPALLRAHIMLETVRLCDVSEKRRNLWVTAIEDILCDDEDQLPAERGEPYLKFGDRCVELARVKEAARSFARAVALGRLDALDGVSFGSIQNWRDIDEDIVEDLQTCYFDPDRRLQLAKGETSRVFAAHAVAAAISHVIAKPKLDVGATFDRMLELLDFMHRANPVWNGTSPLHPGDIARLTGASCMHGHEAVHKSTDDGPHGSKRVKFIEEGAYDPDEFSAGGRVSRRRRRRHSAGTGTARGAATQAAFDPGGGMIWGFEPGGGIPVPGQDSESGASRDGGGQGFEEGGGIPPPRGFGSGGGIIWGFAPGGGVPWGFAPGGGVPWGFASGGGVPWGFKPGGGVRWGFAPGGGVPWGFAPGGGVPWGFAPGGGVPWGFKPGGGVPWGLTPRRGA